MTTTTTNAALTAQDIRALAKADSVVFRHWQGRTTIEAGLGDSLDGDRVYTAVEQRTFPLAEGRLYSRVRTLEVDGVVSGYDREETHSSLERASAFWMIHSARFSIAWTSIVSLLRTGDFLSLHFRGDANSNDYVKGAGLHADRLDLVIERGDKRLVFILAVSVCADNTARMVRPGRES